MMLTWAEGDPEGRVDTGGAGSIEGPAGRELEGAAGGSGEDATPTF